MELKDNRFSIGHAYPFVGKCSQYKPDVAVIVATDGIDADVKEYLANTGVSAVYIENIESIDKELETLLSDHYADKLKNLISSILWGYLLPSSILAPYGQQIDLPFNPYSFVTR